MGIVKSTLFWALMAVALVLVMRSSGPLGGLGLLGLGAGAIFRWNSRHKHVAP